MSPEGANEPDVAVIGGGVVGASIAWGLARKRAHVDDAKAWGRAGKESALTRSRRQAGMIDGKNWSREVMAIVSFVDVNETCGGFLRRLRCHRPRKASRIVSHCSREDTPCPAKPSRAHSLEQYSPIIVDASSVRTF